jgi:hypothetical protein
VRKKKGNGRVQYLSYIFRGGIGSAPRSRPEFGAVTCRSLQVFLNAKQLVVLGDAIGAAGRAGFDLAGVGGHGDVGDGRVLGFAAAMADDGRETVAASQLDAVERLRQRADLVHLDENAVAGSLGDAVAQALGVGHEQIVADQLNFAAELARQFLPAIPIVLGQAVLKRTDWPALAQLLPQVDHLIRGGDAVGLAFEEAIAGLALFLGFVE